MKRLTILLSLLMFSALSAYPQDSQMLLDAGVRDLFNDLNSPRFLCAH